MNTTIYLTRHGQTEWNIEKRLQGRGNSPLTKEGIYRAEELRDRIKDIEIDIIFSSPIKRALDTANIIKGEKSVEIVIDDGLVEMSFGEYEGRIADEVKIENPKWDVELIMKGDVNICAPSGESLLEVRDRVKIAMDKIIEMNKGKIILIVAHGVTLKALMYYFKDIDINTSVMGQTTLTKVIIDENNNFNIEFKNDDTHFSTKNKKIGW